SITWTSVATAATYDVEVRRVADNRLMLSIPGHALTSLTLAADFAIGKYTARIRAVTSSGIKSGWQDSGVIRINRPPVGLTPLGTLTNTAPIISWTIPVGAVRYELQVNDLTRGIKSLIYVGSATNSVTPTLALAVGNYRAWVRAFDETGTATSWSIGWNFRIAELQSEV
ncbi:MAG: hypothetical protein O3A00_15440, partial [Planctomycetota bacterium]|nr:hypothetical protein [Planctomycetota bacterium]